MLRILIADGMPVTMQAEREGFGRDCAELVAMARDFRTSHAEPERRDREDTPAGGAVCENRHAEPYGRH